MVVFVFERYLGIFLKISGITTVNIIHFPTVVQGENVIKRDSTQNLWTVDDWTTAHEFYAKSESALHGKGSVIVDQSQRFDGYPQRLLLPKGEC